MTTPELQTQIAELKLLLNEVAERIKQFTQEFKQAHNQFTETVNEPVRTQT